MVCNLKKSLIYVCVIILITTFFFPGSISSAKTTELNQNYSHPEFELDSYFDKEENELVTTINFPESTDNPGISIYKKGYKKHILKDKKRNISTNKLSLDTTYFYQTNRSKGFFNLKSIENSKKEIISITSTFDYFQTNKDKVSAQFIPVDPPEEEMTIEPNENIETAFQVFPFRDYDEYISSSNDKDFYKIKVTEPKILTINLKGPENTDFDLTLYDENGNIIDGSGTSSSDELIRYALDSDRYYYIEVFGWNGSYNADEKYILSFDEESLPIEGEKDSYEDNNSFEEATEIVLDLTYNGTIHNDSDVDFYTFEVKRNAKMDLKILDKGSSNYNFALYETDTYGKIVDFSTTLSPGKYTLFVFSSDSLSYGNEQYRFSVNLEEVPIILIPGIGGSVLNAFDRDTNEKNVAWLNPNLFSIDDFVYNNLLLNCY